MQASNEFDIHKYLDVFHKYKWHGLVPALVVALMLSIGSSFLPKVYESAFLIEVDRGSIENPLKRGSERTPKLSEHLALFSENALRWDVLSQVVDKVGAEDILENGDIYKFSALKQKISSNMQSGAPSPKDLARTEAVIGFLRNRIKFKQKPPRFLVISYRGIRSDVNVKILNSLVSVLLEERTRTELNQASRNYEFINVETENYRKRLEDAEARLKEFKEEHISELPSNLNLNLTQLTNDKSGLLACELELKELTARVEYIDGQLQKQKELIVTEVKRETNPMLAMLNERIVGMEIELTRLRTNYTDLHPTIVELKGQLEDLKKQRDEVQEATVDSETSMLNPVYQQLAQDRQNTLVRIEVLKERMENLKTRIQQNEKNVLGMPEQEQQLLNLTRNYEVTASIYNMFLQKLEEVRLQEKLATEEKGKESFRVLEYARATFTPVAPVRLKVLLVIALATMGTCVGIMGVFNYFDDSFKSIEEAKEFIGKPLLGTVPSLKDEDGDNRTFGKKRRTKAIAQS